MNSVSFKLSSKEQLCRQSLCVNDQYCSLNIFFVGKYKYYYDNYSLALLLKGVCLGLQGKDFQANMCYQEIVDQ